MGSGQGKFQHRQLIPTFEGSFSGRYETVKILGTGAQGTTYLVRSRAKGAELVAKESHDMTEAGQKAFLAEFENLRGLSHPNCMRVLELVHSRDGEKDNFFVISELARGGDLAARVAKHVQHMELTEEWVAGVFWQVTAGVAYLHRLNIIHNDLKPDNILVLGEFASKTADEVPDVVIADFGCATGLGDGIRTGDPRYMSPEAWLHFDAYSRCEQVDSEQQLTAQSDVYMLGVTLFELLSAGALPFLEQACSLSALLDDDRVYEKFRDAVLSPAEVDIWFGNRISQEGLDILRGLLRKEWSERPVATVMLQHGWFSIRGKPIQSITHRLSIRSPKGKAHAVLLCALAKKVDRSHHRGAQAIFEKTSSDMTGFLSVRDFKCAATKDLDDPEFQNTEEAHAEMEQVFQSANLESNGRMNFTEFLAVTFDWNSLPLLELNGYVEQLLDDLDVDCDGGVDEDDFCRFLENAVDELKARLIFAEINVSETGNMSFEELLQFLFRSGARESLIATSVRWSGVPLSGASSRSLSPATPAFGQIVRGMCASLLSCLGCGCMPRPGEKRKPQQSTRPNEFASARMGERPGMWPDASPEQTGGVLEDSYAFDDFSRESDHTKHRMTMSVEEEQRRSSIEDSYDFDDLGTGGEDYPGVQALRPSLSSSRKRLSCADGRAEPTQRSQSGVFAEPTQRSSAVFADCRNGRPRAQTASARSRVSLHKPSAPVWAQGLPTAPRLTLADAFDIWQPPAQVSRKTATVVRPSLGDLPRRLTEPPRSQTRLSALPNDLGI